MFHAHLIDVAAAFLRRLPDTAACHTRLARALRITVEEARKMMNALRLTGDYDVVFGGLRDLSSGGCCDRGFEQCSEEAAREAR